MTSQGFSKIIQYGSLFEHTGEPRVQIVDPRDVRLYKYASEDVKSCLTSVASAPGKTKVLVLAMSASEYYGPNRNGDAFSEGPVKVNGSWAVAPGEELPAHHKTFETSAHVYRHHINKDPKKSFGDVAQAFYNWNMHRVELLLSLTNAKAQDIVGRIDGGEFPGVSMGCRIRYDVCDICGNRAPTREQYCDHVSGLNPKYGMSKLLENGQRCFVWNPSPHLFDISFVFKPADKIGYTMQKVAYSNPYELRSSADMGQEIDAVQEKTSVLRKLSTIDKILQGEVISPSDTPYALKELKAMESWARSCAPSISENTPDFDDETLKELSKSPIHITMTTMHMCGMVPSAREIFSILCHQKGIPPHPGVRDLVGALQGSVCGLLSDFPGSLSYMDDLEKTLNDDRFVDEKVAEILRPWTEKRAMWSDHLARRYMPENVGAGVSALTGWDPTGAYYSPTWEPMHYRDPNSGRTYQTTRRNAERADWENKKKFMIEATGLAAGLGVGAKALSAGSRNRWGKYVAPPALIGSLYGGKKIMDGQKVPKVRTLEGYEVPANTEFIEKRSWDSSLGGALGAVLLAQDYKRDKVSHLLPGTIDLSAVRQGISKLASYAPALPDNPTDMNFETDHELFEKIGEIIVAYAFR